MKKISQTKQNKSAKSNSPSLKKCRSKAISKKDFLNTFQSLLNSIDCPDGLTIKSIGDLEKIVKLNFLLDSKSIDKYEIVKIYHEKVVEILKENISNPWEKMKIFQAIEKMISELKIE